MPHTSQVEQAFAQIAERETRLEARLDRILYAVEDLDREPTGHEWPAGRARAVPRPGTYQNRLYGGAYAA